MRPEWLLVMAAQTRRRASSPAGGHAFAIKWVPRRLYKIDKSGGPQLSDGSKQRVQASY